jgi:hypothetical protein
LPSGIPLTWTSTYGTQEVSECGISSGYSCAPNGGTVNRDCCRSSAAAANRDRDLVAAIRGNQIGRRIGQINKISTRTATAADWSRRRSSS